MLTHEAPLAVLTSAFRSGQSAIAADHDGRRQIAMSDHVVEPHPEPMPLAVPEPADPRGQPLVGDALAGHPDPSGERLVPGELLQHGSIGRGDIGWIARQRGPAERTLAFAEQRSDVCGDEPGVVERPIETPEPRLGPEVVAVVEDLRSPVEERDHPGDVCGHRRPRPARVSLGIALAQGRGIGQREVLRHVREGVVRARLVGHDVDRRVHRGERGHDVGRVAEDTDRQRLPSVAGVGGQAQGLVHVVEHDVEVAGLDPSLDPRGIHLDAEHDAPVHRHGQRLRAPHASQPGRQGDRPGERPAEALRGDRRERLERSLEDPLRSDVDPRAGRHLAVHRQPERLEPAELLPGRPFRDEVGVRDQDPRSPSMRGHDPHGFARLHQERFVALEPLELADDRIERGPGAGGLPRAAVDHEVLGTLGDVGVQVVHQHPHRGFLLPALARDRRAAGGANLSRSC